jgi:hypothetical protein
MNQPIDPPIALDRGAGGVVWVTDRTAPAPRQLWFEDARGELDGPVPAGLLEHALAHHEATRGRPPDELHLGDDGRRTRRPGEPIAVLHRILHDMLFGAA